MVRTLRRLQDQMAAGSTDALTAQRALITRIEQDFAAADPVVWQDPRNARAAVTYFLSGGNPATLRRMMGQQPPPALDSRLLRGALAYLEGREEEALRQLSEIDPRSLPSSLGGQVALAQAALWVRKDPKRAADLLDTARLLAPGTLVEEAALRRAILVASQAGDAQAFERLARQYLFRFRNSVYAGNFRQRFAAALSRMTFIGDPDQIHRLDDLLEPLEPESRRDLELLVARAAIVQGKTAAAGLAAERALSGTPRNSVDAERARLYRGASLAPNADTYGEALTDLRTVDRDRLVPADVALLDAASATANMVRQAAEGVALPPPAAGPVALAKDETLPVLDRARSAVEAADALLKGAQR
ncbi:chemotaxis protein MotC [Aquabacter spiritensis]|uniref:Chemotaxis protein MotC n=1 Tax=Aquabacter spiritensis TaxID=933073 RepID=A0A4R3M6M9_9HYPH|nr:chemotaxis protein MotC [Aquabacter spiritensis]TCT07919.1 chemotaxis protein MotC [Aquabacter spiritensis]